MNSPPRANAVPRSCFVPAIGLLVIVGALCLWMAWMRGSSSRHPELTRNRFDEALSMWGTTKPANYDITVDVQGMQAAIYTVSVRDGSPIAATHDGRALKDHRTFGTWAVPGMFETLRRDLATDDEHHYLLLKAEFDSTLGFPSGYERIELRTGAHDALQWQVTSFVANPSDAD